MNATSEYTDAGKVRKSKAGSNLGWHKHEKNMDIREKMKEKGIGQAKLSLMLDVSVTQVNRLLNRDLPWNIRMAILESIKRYDPETNPLGR